ncbi:MAG: hypothetical protein WCF04_04545 [Candidatus Nanopelagicales bacterium]
MVRPVGSVRRAAPGGGIYLIRDFLLRTATERASAPIAGDDAEAARWVTRTELESLPLVEGLVEALTAWSVLPD